MDIQNKGIITLLRSALSGERLALPEGFDLEAAQGQILRHQVASGAFLGAANCGISKKDAIMQRLFQRYCAELLFSEEQAQAVEQMLAELERAGIDYMPLKGVSLKKLYPRPELRAMGDADILIRKDQYSMVEAIALEQGYEYEDCTTTQNWRKGKILFEFHTVLIPDVASMAGYHDYFSDSWQRAVPAGGCRYAMGAEDEYIYLFMHFSKHYLIAGIGCRQLMDLWLYRKAHPGMDQEYNEAERQKLHLQEFHQNLLQTMNVWFEGQEEDEISALITDFIFLSGSWGVARSNMLSRGVRFKAERGATRASKGLFAMKTIFPPASEIRITYPVLKNHPYLVPVFWIVRIFDVLRTRRGNVKKRFQEARAVDAKEVAAYEEALSKVGLRYLARAADHEV